MEKENKKLGDSIAPEDRKRLLQLLGGIKEDLEQFRDDLPEKMRRIDVEAKKSPPRPPSADMW